MVPTESKSVQSRIIKYSTEVGWKYVPRKESDARRGDRASYKNERYYRDILNTKLWEFNSWLPKNYNLPDPTPKIEGNRQFLLALRGQSTAYDENEKREKMVSSLTIILPIFFLDIG